MASKYPPTQNVFLETILGIKEWVGQFSAEHRSFFLPTGLLDWLPFSLTADPIKPLSPPPNAPPGRVRSFIVDRILQLQDEAGLLRPPAEMIGSDQDGIMKAIAAGLVGHILIRDDSQSPPFTWGHLNGCSLDGHVHSGDKYDYTDTGVSTAAQIQYARVFLLGGKIYQNGSIYRTIGGLAGRTFRVGIYDQADSQDHDGDPLNKIAETAETSTAGAVDIFIEPVFTTPLTVPETGFYWIACVTNTGTPLQFQRTPGSYPQNFLNIRRETGSGATLPSVASGLSNPAATVTYVAIHE